MAELKLPVSEESIRNLEVGDFVELTGRMITGRDTAHTWLIEDYRDGGKHSVLHRVLRALRE